MKHKSLITFIIIGLNNLLNGDVQISISGYNGEAISLSTHGRENGSYVYVDENSHIVNSTIGTSVHIDSEPLTKEERIVYYTKKIYRYEDKIENYWNKIDKYKEKIINKPKNRERYERKIDKYREKIEEYRSKIREAEHMMNRD